MGARRAGRGAVGVFAIIGVLTGNTWPTAPQAPTRGRVGARFSRSGYLW